MIDLPNVLCVSIKLSYKYLQHLKTWIASAILSAKEMKNGSDIIENLQACIRLIHKMLSKCYEVNKKIQHRRNCRILLNFALWFLKHLLSLQKKLSENKNKSFYNENTIPALLLCFIKIPN